MAAGAPWTYWGEDAQGTLHWLLSSLLPTRLSFALTPDELGVLPEHSELWDAAAGQWVPRT